MKASLVILAAGLGSRYGGDKQVDGVGPNHEILMEYGIYDALRAGFSKIVFIIKPGMEQLMDRLCGDYLRQKTAKDGSAVEVVYVRQDFSSIPAFYAIPPERTKPFGTVHALLCAEDAVKEPCCVINADDYYGVGAYRAIYEELQRMSVEGQATMVGYQLDKTASLSGTVSRGVCTVESGQLVAVKETKKIQMYPDGTLRDQQADCLLDPKAVVSMNFWGFMPSVFPAMRGYFHDFLCNEAGENITAECLLPVMVDHFLKTGALAVSVLPSTDHWFGMTYQEDRAIVTEEIRKLHLQGVYPEILRK